MLFGMTTAKRPRLYEWNNPRGAVRMARVHFMLNTRSVHQTRGTFWTTSEYSLSSMKIECCIARWIWWSCGSVSWSQCNYFAIPQMTLNNSHLPSSKTFETTTFICRQNRIGLNRSKSYIVFDLISSKILVNYTKPLHPYHFLKSPYFQAQQNQPLHRYQLIRRSTLLFLVHPQFNLFVLESSKGTHTLVSTSRYLHCHWTSLTSTTV